MKILMLCDFYHESLEYQEQLCAKFYVKHGHAVTVVTSTHGRTDWRQRSPASAAIPAGCGR